MAYVPTTFVDRSVEFPNRRTLTAVPGQADTVDIGRAEGTVFAEGTKPDAANLNAEFGKIKDETDAISTSLTVLGDYDLYYTTSNSPTNQVTVDLTKYRYVALFPSVGSANSIHNIGYIPTGLFKAKVNFQQFRNDSTYATAIYVDDNTIKLYQTNCVGANFVGIK